MTLTWKKYFMLIEGALIVSFSLLIVWLAYADQPQISQFVAPSDADISILSALASFFGTMLAFVIAIVTYLLGIADSKSFSILRASHSYRNHWSIFKGALYSCFIATCLCVAGLIAAWFSAFYKFHALAIVAAAVWVFFRLVRVVWVMKQMIDAELRLGDQARDKLS